MEPEAKESLLSKAAEVSCEGVLAGGLCEDADPGKVSDDAEGLRSNIIVMFVCGTKLT